MFTGITTDCLLQKVLAQLVVNHFTNSYFHNNNIIDKHQLKNDEITVVRRGKNIELYKTIKVMDVLFREKNMLTSYKKVGNRS